jgi:hypothetical protein
VADGFGTALAGAVAELVSVGEQAVDTSTPAPIAIKSSIARIKASLCSYEEQTKAIIRFARLFLRSKRGA